MFIRDLYEAPAKRIVAVMPGGFHPFHPGHKSLYDWAVKTFGQGNVYVAATNDTAARPFPFDVKKKLAGMAGVPESNFIQVKSPFNAMSYQDIVDDNTALVFVRSEKDKAEQPKPDQTKKNGEPGYLRTYTGKDLNSSNEMGYMAYGPTINFDFSGMQIKSASELRATWPKMSDEDKHKAATLMYGNGHDEAVQLLNKALGGSDAPVEEDGVDGVTGQTVRAMARLKARYPHADSDLELMLAAITDNKNLIKATDFDNDEEADDLAARLDKIEKAVKNIKSKKESVKEADVVVDKSSLVPYIKNLIMDYLDKEQDVEKLSKLLKMMVGREIKTRGGKRYTITREDISLALQKNG
jgi:hypothetical protein